MSCGNKIRKAVISGEKSNKYTMLELHKNKNALPLSSERETTVADEKIDEIVYGLYGVLAEERKIIESTD